MSHLRWTPGVRILAALFAVALSLLPRYALAAPSVLATPAYAATRSEIPSPAVPPVLVNDFAGVFSPSQVDSLERVLVAFDDSTSNQICVVTVKTLAGMDVQEFALRLAQKWGIGTKEHQNGVLVLIKPRGFDNNYIDVNIQVGRGLEGAIPDTRASRIIRNVMGPYLRQDQYWPAVVKACDALKALASGEYKESRDGLDDDDAAALVALCVFVLGILIVVIFVIVLAGKNGKGGKGGNSGKSGGGPTIWFGNGPFGGSGKGGSGHGGGFGGFGGFGGSSGGGFGGFGGGGFGGGGASGRF